jgi:hypothetical protein
MKLQAQRFHSLVAVLVGILAVAAPMLGQAFDKSEPEPAIIVGTVTAVNGDTVPDATVVLEGADANDRRTVTTNDDGYFEFHDVKFGIPYRVKINAEGFQNGRHRLLRLSQANSKS